MTVALVIPRPRVPVAGVADDRSAAHIAIEVAVGIEATLAVLAAVAVYLSPAGTGDGYAFKRLADIRGIT